MQSMRPHTPPLAATRPEAGAPRSDPAPSRWSWRLQRLLLTPGIRFCLKLGIPCALLIGGGAVYMSDIERRDALFATVAELRTKFETRPEFMVSVMRVTGASDEVSADIRDIVPVDLPASSFDIDLENLRAAITDLDPVKSASVRVRPGGVLEIGVTERVPAVVWRSYEQVALVDETGAHVALIDMVHDRYFPPD